MAKIKKNDKVIVIAGKDKGKHGTVVRVLNNERVVVDGVNMFKKHVKPNPQKGDVGGIVQIEKSIHISNVAIYNIDTNKPDRIKFKINEDGKKFRVYASTEKNVD